MPRRRSSRATAILAMASLMAICGCDRASVETASFAPSETPRATVVSATASPVRVSTADGRLSFELPTGWTWERCNYIRDTCVDLRPPAPWSYAPPISVSIDSPREGMPSDLYIGMESAQIPEELRTVFQPTEVDGLPALRFQEAEAAPVRVYGYTAVGDRFSVDCELRGDERVRAGCALVTATLKIRR
jgi:hypothetical protein